jgi:hypothetical protein
MAAGSLNWAMRQQLFVLHLAADYKALANVLEPITPPNNELLFSKAKPILWEALKQTRGHVVANTIATENLVR